MKNTKFSISFLSLNHEFEQCNIANFASSLQGKETSDSENCKQCPFFDELHAIFTERAMNMQQLLQSETVTGNPFTKKAKRSKRDKLSSELSDDNEDDDEDSDAKVHEHKKPKLASIQVLLKDFFQKQQLIDAQWRDLIEKRAQERRIFENEWRKSMEKLERERLRLEQSWQQREEQRRLREESRAVKRDALLTTILTNLVPEDL